MLGLPALRTSHFFYACACLLLASLLGGLTTGCQQARWEAVRRQAAYPPDFALVVHVRPIESSPTDPFSAQYIVQPDRLLRAATGAGTTIDYFPRPTRLLTPNQMAELAHLALATREPPAQRTTGQATHHGILEITANGKHTRLDVLFAPTGPQANVAPSAAESLVTTLTTLSGLAGTSADH